MGPISAFLTSDHGRLDRLLTESVAGEGPLALPPFDEFREGLLRHIGMEETILLPAIMKKEGAPAKLLARLRLDHGALTNLLVPEPTRDIVKALVMILAPHNRAEEEPGGFYDACDGLVAAEAAALVAKMKAAPKLPLRPYSKRPEALEAAKRAMERAGYRWQDAVA